MIEYPASSNAVELVKFFNDVVIYSPLPCTQKETTKPPAAEPAKSTNNQSTKASVVTRPLSSANPFRRRYCVDKQSGEITSIVSSSKSSPLASSDSPRNNNRADTTVKSSRPHAKQPVTPADKTAKFDAPQASWFSTTATSRLVPNFDALIKQHATSGCAATATSTISSSSSASHSNLSPVDWVAHMYATDVYPTMVAALAAVCRQRDRLEVMGTTFISTSCTTDADANIAPPSVSVSFSMNNSGDICSAGGGGGGVDETSSRTIDPQQTSSLRRTPSASGSATRSTLPLRRHQSALTTASGSQARNWLGQLASLVDTSDPLSMLSPSTMRRLLLEAPARRAATAALISDGLGSVVSATVMLVGDVLLSASLSLLEEAVTTELILHSSPIARDCVTSFVKAVAAIEELRRRLWESASNQPAVLKGSSAFSPRTFVAIKQWSLCSSQLTDIVMRSHVVVTFQQQQKTQPIPPTPPAPANTSNTTQALDIGKERIDGVAKQQLQDHLQHATIVLSRLCSGTNLESGNADHSAAHGRLVDQQYVLLHATMAHHRDDGVVGLHQAMVDTLRVGRTPPRAAPETSTAEDGQQSTQQEQQQQQSPLKTASFRVAPTAMRRRPSAASQHHPAAVHSSPPPSSASSAHWMRTFAQSLQTYRGDLAVFLATNHCSGAADVGLLQNQRQSKDDVVVRNAAPIPPAVLSCALIRAAVRHYMVTSLRSHKEHHRCSGGAMTAHRGAGGDAEDEEEDEDLIKVVSQGIPWPYPLALLQELVNVHGGDAVVRRNIFVGAAGLLATIIGKKNPQSSTNSSRDDAHESIDGALGVLRLWQQCFHPDVIAPAVEGTGAPKCVGDAARRSATAHVQRVVWLRDALYSL